MAREGLVCAEPRAVLGWPKARHKPCRTKARPGVCSLPLQVTFPSPCASVTQENPAPLDLPPRALCKINPGVNELNESAGAGRTASRLRTPSAGAAKRMFLRCQAQGGW